MSKSWDGDLDDAEPKLGSFDMTYERTGKLRGFGSIDCEVAERRRNEITLDEGRLHLAIVAMERVIY